MARPFDVRAVIQIDSSIHLVKEALPRDTNQWFITGCRNACGRADVSSNVIDIRYWASSFAFFLPLRSLSKRSSFKTRRIFTDPLFLSYEKLFNTNPLKRITHLDLFIYLSTRFNSNLLESWVIIIGLIEMLGSNDSDHTSFNSVTAKSWHSNFPRDSMDSWIIPEQQSKLDLSRSYEVYFFLKNLSSDKFPFHVFPAS